MPDPTPKPPPRFRLATWQIYCLAGIVLFALFVVARLLLYALVDRELARIQADGYPISDAQLNAFYKTPPSDENAALLYEKAQLLISGSPFPESQQSESAAPDPKLGDPSPADQLESMRQYLQKNKDALDLIEKASKLPKCRYSFDYTDFSTVTDKSAPQNLFDPISFRIQYATETGDVEAALHWLKISHSLIDSLASAPDIISQDFRIDATNRFVHDTLRLLNKNRLNQSQLAALADLYHDPPLDSDIQRVVIFQRIDAIKDAQKNLLGLSPFYDFAYRSSGMAQIDELNILRQFDQVPAKAKLFGGKTYLILRDLDREADNLPRSYVLSRWQLKQLEHHLANALRNYPMFAFTRVAIAVERYRLDHAGLLPPHLADLAPAYLPAAPNDPWYQLPMVLNPKPHGYKIRYAHSLGPYSDGVEIHTDQPTPTTRP